MQKPNPFDYFEQIHCINLDHRTDRWETCLEEFSKVDIQSRVQRFSAIAHTEPFIGFCKSQIAVLKLCSEAAAPVLVLEDDVMFQANTSEILSLAIAQLPVNWEILYLGAMVFKGDFKGRKVSANLVTADGVVCTQAMAYNVGVPERIVRGYDHPFIYKVRRNIYDCHLANVWHRRNTSFIVNPMVAWQHAGYSDLSNEASVGTTMFELTQQKLNKYLWNS